MIYSSLSRQSVKSALSIKDQKLLRLNHCKIIVPWSKAIWYKSQSTNRIKSVRYRHFEVSLSKFHMYHMWLFHHFEMTKLELRISLPHFVTARQKSIATHAYIHTKHTTKINQQKRYKIYINVRDYNEIVQRTKLNEPNFIANRTKKHDSHCKVQWWRESDDEAESEKFRTNEDWKQWKEQPTGQTATRNNKNNNEMEYRISLLTEIDRDFVDHF